MKVSRSFVRSISTTLLIFTAALFLSVAGFADKLQLERAPINPEYAKYLKGESKVSSLLQETGEHGTGLIPPFCDTSYLKGKHLNLTGNRLMATLPTSYDLRDHNKVTPVKNQGGCGSCWAFAAIGSLESSLLSAENTDFSENNMKNLSGFTGEDYDCCSGGNYDMAAAYLLRWAGPVSESDDPYDENSCVSTSHTSYTAEKHVQEYIQIPPRESSLDNDNIKQAIMTYGAVAVSFAIYTYSGYGFYNPATYAYYMDMAVGTNHGVCIVGWDDNYSKSNFTITPPGDGAFIVKNSWAASWGDHGYFYISYYDANLMMWAASCVFTADSTDNYSKIYQYDPLGWVSRFGYNNETAWFANVFTASDNQPLTAVGWYTAEPNSPYEIYIYKDPTSGPVSSGGYALKQTGTVANPGYTTIQLDTPVGVTKGQKFSAVVKLTTPDYTFPVPVELADDNRHASSATSNPGESYISPDGNNWEDYWVDYSDKKINNCLKVYAGSPATVPPELQITSPTTEPTYCTSQNTINICGIASDNRAVSSVTWQNTTQGTPAQLCQDGGDWTTWWTGDINIEPNTTNNIVFTATDSDGNQTTASITIINDSISPSVTITSPTSEDHYWPETSTIDIGGTASDNLGVVSVSWFNSGTGAIGTYTCDCKKNATWSASGLALADGENANVITVTATDLAGHTATDTLTVTHYPALKDIRVFPSKVGLVQGMSQEFKAVPIDINGNIRPLAEGSSLTWSATTGEIDSQTGLFKAGSGSSVVTVKSGSAASQVNVEVFSATKAGGYALERWWGGNVDKPIGVAIGLDGSVYLADSLNNRIQKYSSTGSYDDSFSGIGSDPFDTPRGIAIDSLGNFYISDTRNNRIQKYSPDWELVAGWGSYGTGNGQFVSPHGIAVDGSDNVYVADSGNNRIQKFNSNGNYLAQLSSSTTTGADFSWPRDVSVVDKDGTRYIYVVDTLNNRVVMFTETTSSSLTTVLYDSKLGVTNTGLSQSVTYHLVKPWGSGGIGDGEFMNPTGIEVGMTGDVFVSDYINNRVQVFDSTGNFVGKWGEYGTSGGQFVQPTGIRQDADGNVYVVDMNNDRVQKFVPDEDTTVVITSPEAGFDGFWHNSSIPVVGTTTGIVVGLTWSNSTTGDSGICTGVRTWSVAGVPLTLGRNNIVITAQDSAGNEVKQTLTIYYTQNAHALVVTTPSLNPSTVESGSTTTVGASAVDSQGHDVTYSWSDGGAGGSFANPSASSTTYTVPVNSSSADKVVTITCHAVCKVDSAITGSASAQLIVTGGHVVTLTGPTLTPSTIDPGKTTVCAITAIDSRCDLLKYRWSDSGAGGTFSPSVSAQNPTYTAPTNTTDGDKHINITCTATCTSISTTKATGTAVLTVTNPKPIISITGPTSDDSTTRTGASINLSGTASDDTTTIKWANLGTGASGTISGATSWKIDGIEIVEGDTNVITVTARDAAGQSAFDSLQVTRESTPVEDAWKGMVMVSLPIIPDDTDPKNVVSFYDMDWMMYRTKSGKYFGYGNDTNHYCWFDPTSATPGRGFWAMFEDTPIEPCGEVPDQAASTEKDPNVVSIHLYKGWNLIGQPFMKTVTWDTTAITVQTVDSASMALNKAGTYVKSYAWGWQQDDDNPLTGKYYLVGNPGAISGATDKMAPWRAYWIKALQECYLVIPAP
ncbi:MAG: lectin like domain-containing protein [Armatimonadota bacterium]